MCQCKEHFSLPDACIQTGAISQSGLLPLRSLLAAAPSAVQSGKELHGFAVSLSHGVIMGSCNGGSRAAVFKSAASLIVA